MDIDNEKESRGSNWALALAIFIAGLMIAMAVIYSTGKQNLESQINQKSATTTKSEILESKTPENIRAVSQDDHIFGNPEAPVKLVGFSDTECFFCKQFHQTMRKIIQEQGANGNVAWIYRHFPLDRIHSKARKEAEATECANELGGNKKFWAYLDRLFEITPSNNNLNPSELPAIAEYVGLNRSLFEECLNSNKYGQRVQDDLDDAIRSGGTGTPYSVIIAPNGKKFTFSGAQPYSTVKSMIDSAMQEK